MQLQSERYCFVNFCKISPCPNCGAVRGIIQRLKQEQIYQLWRKGNIQQESGNPSSGEKEIYNRNLEKIQQLWRKGNICTIQESANEKIQQREVLNSYTRENLVEKLLQFLFSLSVCVSFLNTVCVLFENTVPHHSRLPCYVFCIDLGDLSCQTKSRKIITCISIF